MGDVMIDGMFDGNEENIAYPAPGSRAGGPAAEHVHPHVVVLFGATGDLARRKLLPGLVRLSESALTPDVRIVGTSSWTTWMTLLFDSRTQRNPGVRRREAGR
jgi:Glucose-6-phosphate dehydrogenase, NAD binding domain